MDWLLLAKCIRSPSATLRTFTSPELFPSSPRRPRCTPARPCRRRRTSFARTSMRKGFACRSHPGPLRSLHRRLFRLPSLSSLKSTARRSPGRRPRLHGHDSAISPRPPATVSPRRSQPPAASHAVQAAMRGALRRAPLAARVMRMDRVGQKARRQTETEMATATASATQPRAPKALPTGTVSIPTAAPQTEKLRPSLPGARMLPARVRVPMPAATANQRWRPQRKQAIARGTALQLRPIGDRRSAVRRTSKSESG